MGKVITDFGTLVNKTSGGLIVLPRDHPLIVKKALGRPAFSRIGQSVCDQCSFCTELCPRYLLGHSIQPHRAMRSLLFSGGGRKIHSEYALLCCECSLCTLYSCPEGLSPCEVCVAAKSDLREMKVGFKNSALNPGRAAAAHPVREERKVPVSKLIRRRPGGLCGRATGPIRMPVYTVEPAHRRPCPRPQRQGDVVGDLPAEAGLPGTALTEGVRSTINMEIGDN